MSKKKTEIADLKAQARKGDAEAAASLALLYEVGLLGEPDIKTAKKYHEQAAKAGNKLSQISLAEFSKNEPTSSQVSKNSKDNKSIGAAVKIGNKIIIVDTSKAQRQELAEHLEKDFQVIEAANGLEGLNCLRKNPDTRLIFTDIAMPEMDGVVMIEKIRRSKSFYDIPIVVVSADNRAGTISKLKKAGINGWITKPFGEELVLKSANRWVKFK